MNLLLNRDQNSAALFTLIPLRLGSGVMFKLHAELELDAEEKDLMQKYQFAKAPLVLSDPIDDLKMHSDQQQFLDWLRLWCFGYWDHFQRHFHWPCWSFLL